MPTKVQSSHFQTTQKLKVDYSPHSLTEYVSHRTGMRVVVVGQSGPKVLGFFAAATEIWDDSGSPHTLEHLCFMGSKTYPYKGLLDKLATRGYSNTNAWTATDHTAYTLETAGYAAFAQILPVYLEHIVLPTLTDSGCYTEVFHIDGSGHDAGVVYSEMQGVQHTQAELMELRSKRLLYPEGVGFRYETGGMMEQLRILNADRIRQFHRDMYQPKNLCLIIVGDVDHTHLLSTLDTFEESIMDDIPKPDSPFKRPWVDSPQPPSLKNSVVETVEFPEEDESVGEISIKYFGPSCNNVIEFAAMGILLTYLAGSSASVLENILVEKEQVATAVYYNETPRPNSVIEFTLSGVDATKLAEIEARFLEIIQKTAQKELDMHYMIDCINREKRQQKYYAETSETFFTSAIISTFLFDKSRDLTYLTHLKQFDELLTWTELMWRQFLKQWIADAPRITILGKPSEVVAKKTKFDEETRVAEQIKRLGPKGLSELEEKLRNAQEQNDREIPKELLEGFKVPGTDTIHFITSVPAHSGAARDLGAFKNKIQDIVDRDPSDIPLFLHFEHVPSNFVHINLLINTSTIPVALRPMLTIYMENFFNSPIMRGGKRIEFEEVVKGLERDTIDYRISSGGGLGNTEILNIAIQIENENYAIATRWLKDLLWNGIFDVERIKSTTAKLFMDVPEEKRSGSSMVYSVATMVNESPESIGRARNTLVKALYLKRVRKLLEIDPDKIIAQLEAVKRAVCQMSSFRSLVIADIERLERPISAWNTLAEGQDFSKPLAPLDRRLDRLSSKGQNPGNLSYIVTLPTVDSSFALSVVKGPEDSRDPQVPALMVAVSFLDAVEGPLWNGVRGTGLAYGYSFKRRIGQIEYSVYRSPDAYKAFAASKKVVEDFVRGVTPFESLALEGAISSIVLNIATSQSTMASAAQDSFIKQVIKELPREWNDVLLEKIRKVTVEEIKQVMKDLLMPAFEAKTANLFVTCSPVMEESLVSGFRSIGFAPEVKPLAFFQDDYGLKTGDGDDEDDDDEEDIEDLMDGGTEDSDDEDEEMNDENIKGRL